MNTIDNNTDIPDAKKIIDVKNLKITIKIDEGLLTPVRGVSFSIKEQETLGLVGESGCGKSLASKAILGINIKNCQRSGEILFLDDNNTYTDLLQYKRTGKEMRDIRGNKISMIFQEPMSSFSPLFKVGTQVSEAARLHITRDKKKARQIALDMLEKVRLADPEKQYNQFPHQFSGGMLQRALIATSLVCKPRLLIADEPTTALDVTIQAQILKLMKELQKEINMSILFITHDLGTVAGMCDRVAVMYLGRIVESAPVGEIFEKPRHPYTRALMGAIHKIGTVKDKLYSIKGTVTLAMNLKDRCSFYERCEERDEKLCNEKEPDLINIGHQHYVACYKASKMDKH